MHNLKKSTRSTIVAIALIVLVGVLAACGGSDAKSSAPGGKVDEAGLAKAKADVEEFSKRPTDLGISQPIGKPVPSGKTINFIYCGVTICNTFADAVSDAAKILGWKSETITTDGTPESVKAAWATAVRNKPDAVISTGWDTAAYAPELAKLKAMGVAVFNASTTDAGPTGNVTARIGDPVATGVSGKQLAAWVVADTEGKASTLYVDLPAYVILKSTREQFDENYAAYCEKCPLDHMDLPVTALGKDAPNRIVTYLRSHPDVNYVAFAQDAGSIGLPAALKAAGLTGKVKFAGIAGNTQNLQYVKDGDEAASINQGYYEEMYALVDSAARSVAGVELDEILDYQVPFWIDTQESISDTSRFSPVLPDLDQKAAALWGK